MKRQIFLFAVSMLAATSFAQTYKPVLSEGKSWKYATVYYDNSGKPYVTGNYDVVLAGDTVVNERACKKITIRNENGTSPAVTAVAYEDNGKVYGLSGETFVLRLDMGLKKGDEINGVERVVGEDEVVVNGISRKRLVVDSGIDSSLDFSSYTVVEGIGRDKLLGGFDWGTKCQYASMVACYENGEKVFDKSDFDKGTSSISRMNYSETNDNGLLYNLAGQQVDNSYKGVVIQNGRKFRR